MSEKKVYIPTESILEVSLTKGSESPLAIRAKGNDGLPKLTAQEVQDWFLTLEEAKVELGVAHLAYARRLVKDNKLEGIKVKVPGGSRWLVTRESIGRYDTRRVRSRELRNYIFRIPMDKEEAVKKLLKNAGIPYSLEIAYEKKEKPPKAGEGVWATLIAKLEG